MQKAKTSTYLIITLLLVGNLFLSYCQTSDLYALGLHVIPYPQQVEMGGGEFIFKSPVNIILDKNASGVDRQTAEQLKKELEEEWGLRVIIGEGNSGSTLILTRKGASKTMLGQGYKLSTNTKVLTITGKGEDGLFYGVQTLFQLIKKGRGQIFVPGMNITDWPDIKKRAIHYDTKHHQDKGNYVKDFIRDLARYKINMLVWENKLAYQSHPEIGAPGAFTIEEMQEFTRYARQYHIGSDETYELGQCKECRAKAKENHNMNAFFRVYWMKSSPWHSAKFILTGLDKKAQMRKAQVGAGDIRVLG
ncbi:MAG: beta-N-acetylhexosaminidase [Flavobacteriaceae bacterium]